jgi:hypothetical protein
LCCLFEMSDQDLAAAFVVLIKLKKRKRRWSKEWFKKRQKYTHEHLLRDLALTEVNDFKNFVRLDLAKFQELLDLTTPLIEKKKYKYEGSYTTPINYITISCNWKLSRGFKIF